VEVIWDMMYIEVADDFRPTLWQFRTTFISHKPLRPAYNQVDHDEIDYRPPSDKSTFDL
jgi:hypothetical protein